MSILSHEEFYGLFILTDKYVENKAFSFGLLRQKNSRVLNFSGKLASESELSNLSIVYDLLN